MYTGKHRCAQVGTGEYKHTQISLVLSPLLLVFLLFSQEKALGCQGKLLAIPTTTPQRDKTSWECSLSFSRHSRVLLVIALVPLLFFALRALQLSFSSGPGSPVTSAWQNPKVASWPSSFFLTFSSTYQDWPSLFLEYSLHLLRAIFPTAGSPQTLPLPLNP